MDKIIGAITAAAAVLQFAAKEVKAFVTANTPESALLAALALDYNQYAAGTISGPRAAGAAFAALVLFMITESSKDKTAPTPPAIP